MATYRDEAVVLRTHKLGEADRIITLLSRRHGMVRAAARGVRRTSSKFGARLEPFSYVDIQLATGRSLDIVTQVESLAAFGDRLASDFPRYAAGQVMLETADRLVVEEHQPALQQFLLLVGALRVLNDGTSDGPRDNATILDSFLLRSLAAAGYAPTFTDCAKCAAEGPHRAFSPGAGGMVCRVCRPPGSAQPRTQTVTYLAALLTGNWPATRDTPPEIICEGSGLTAAFVTWQLERGLRSLAHLER